MIKSINSDTVRIGPVSELISSQNSKKSELCWALFRLPLFSTKPSFIRYAELKDNPICLQITRELYHNELSLSLVEIINKAWNDFIKTN